jgi:GTP cyclohydrolase I
MAENDKELGRRVHERLVALKLETPFGGLTPDGVVERSPERRERSCTEARHQIQSSFKSVLQALSLNTNDESLRDTPKRVAKMYCDEIFFGLDYNNFPACTPFPPIGNGSVKEMVLERRIKVHSMCEHHFVPFIGHAHVAYIPGPKVIGLSKLNRVVDFFCRRPQVQERLAEQIYAALELVLETSDVAVVIEAEHLCVKLRGVKDHNSDTVTSKLGGKFMEVPPLRAEFMSLIRSA